MKLKEKHVDTIVRKIIEVLKQKSLITFKHPEGPVHQTMKKVFLDNLKQEEEILNETQKLLDQIRKTARESIDEKKMFHMIKKEICKKKNFII